MSLLSWLTGSGESGAAQLASTANNIVSQWITNPADREKVIRELLEANQADVQSARQFANAQAGDTGFNAIADGINKLVRPALALGVIGGLYGWWPLPDVSHLPDFYATLGYSVIGFYFGVVSVVDDLPRAVGRILRLIKG